MVLGVDRLVHGQLTHAPPLGIHRLKQLVRSAEQRVEAVPSRALLREVDARRQPERPGDVAHRLERKGLGVDTHPETGAKQRKRRGQARHPPTEDADRITGVGE